MASQEYLRRFLLYCGREGYATLNDETEARRKEPDGSTTIVLEKDGWRFHDNYFGGEPFGGREVVFDHDRPVWIMVYYGEVIEKSGDVGTIYVTLRRALALVPDEAPYRGPREFIDGDLTYRNSWRGEVESFSGEEEITRAGQVVYQARYAGGLVDQV